MSKYSMDQHSILGRIECEAGYTTLTDKFSECAKGYFNTNEYFTHNISTTEADTLYIETNTLKCKIGNGTSPYSEIEYINVTPPEFAKFVSDVNSRFMEEKKYTHNNIGNLKAHLRDMTKRVRNISDSLSDVEDTSSAHDDMLLDHKKQILNLQTEYEDLTEELDRLSLKLTFTQRLSIIGCGLGGLSVVLSIISLL